MPEPTSMPDGLDEVMNHLIAAARGQREQAIETWTRGCDLYAHYISDLGRAQTPAEVYAAATEFFTGGMEALTRNLAAMSPLNGATPPSPPRS